MNTIVTDIAYDPVLFSPSGDEMAKNKKVAEEVESLFIFQLLKEMDATVEREEDSFMYSEYEETYRGLFNQEIAREVSRAGGIGIQDMVEKNLEQLSGAVQTELEMQAASLDAMAEAASATVAPERDTDVFGMMSAGRTRE